MKTKQTERLELDGEKFLPVKQMGAGAGGLCSVSAALATAGALSLILPDVETIETGAGVPVEYMSIGVALATVHQPAGALLRECQGLMDLALADSCARKLAGRMRAAGVHVSPESVEDAASAGCVALQVWRTTGKGADGERETLAPRVAWRAAVLCLSSDRFGESCVSFETVTDGDLWAAAEFVSESRQERAARYRVERAARGGVLTEPVRVCVGKVNASGALVGYETIEFPAGQKIPTRQLQLTKRMARVPLGRGRRAAVIERVTNCAALLLDGFRLDEAATAAGFNPSGNGRGRHTAADRFCQAAQRLGFKGWQLHARQSMDARAARRAATPDGGLVEGELDGAEFVPFEPREPREFEPLACFRLTAQPVGLPVRGPAAFTSPEFIGARLPVGALSCEPVASWRGWLFARQLARRNGHARARAVAVFNDGKRALIARAMAAGDGAAGKAAARAIRRARCELVLPVEAGE